MAAFQQAFSATQDDTGLVTFLDESTWDVSDEHYDKADFVRQIEMKDAFGVLIDTVVFASNSLAATYQFTVNKWVVAKYSITGVADFVKTEKFGFQRLFELAYIQETVNTCNCGCGDAEADMCMVDTFYQNAAFAVPVGDGVSFQNNIDSAYKLLN